MKNKKILLAMPIDYSLSKLIIKNLEALGLTVVYINPDETEGFKYKSFSQRLKNLYRKIVLGDKSFKRELKKNHYLKTKYQIIDTYDTYDYCLFIRADFFHDEIIEYCKTKCNQFVAYHYDGINRDKTIFNKIPFFDSFFVFDKEDLKIDPTFKFITNFYFDYPEIQKNDTLNEFDFYFLGSYHSSRKNMIFDLYKALIKISDKVKFDIVFDKDNYNKISEYKDQKINCFQKILAYELYLENTKNSKIIIDIVINEHKGLSFRIFEGLKYSKKIITTNNTIKDYPFYNENNIFLLNVDNFNEIEAFLKKPYVTIDQEIIKTYSFTNWFKNIFKIDPYIAIK